MLIHSLVRQVRTYFCLGIHADRRTVDDHIVFLDYLGCDALILDSALTLISADENRFQSKIAQSVVNSLRRTSCSKNQRLLMPFLLQHGLDTLGKSDDVAIITLQLDIVALVSNTDDVHSADGTGFRGHVVKEWHYLFFIRNGDIQSTKVRIRTQHLVECINGGNLVILVNSINAFVLKLLVKITDGERMSKRETDKSVFIHNR